MRIERGERYLCVYTSYDIILNEVFYTRRTYIYIKCSLTHILYIYKMFSYSYIYIYIYIYDKIALTYSVCSYQRVAN